ncbi:rRNA maturation RNase YbeY [Pseudoclavibacter alba]|uniref:Endoribonuclease YbeY n=1 Tax=Pseudoclavibacter albus TaxID=272241 RepID=A0ABT2HX74_9MICO|nr:rRNA maturation RNase YbeY [Pseudoclavibacter alba]MBN6777816.1 rRNA maturation RNase YbeY [Pseudoclavibacter alba]MCT2042922.1 rRNA maturation RNase YbeY [Pseudoclavibacter alba]
MSIEITNETSAEVDEARILKLASYVLDQLHIHQDAELAIMFVETGPMEELHIQWMNEPGPTDVLSFPMDELRPGAVDRPTDPGLLGDIVVCPEVAEQQARTAGHSMMEEILLLVTHGMLHLVGFDHAEPEEHRVMFGLQRDLLVGFALREREETQRA